jgi:hypothetical protein
MVDESVAAHFSRYDAFVESTRSWLGKRADRYHWYYNSSRIALIVFSVSIPALSSGLFGERGKVATPFVALVIALLASLDGLLKPGDNWRHFRSYQLALDRFERVSRSKRAALELETDPEKNRQKQFDLYRQFVLEIEEVLEEESKRFFEHQIQQLKTPPGAVER